MFGVGGGGGGGVGLSAITQIVPLTDNTILSDGNRYAAYMRTFYSDFQTVSITLMWFPKGYFTPRERPLNYTEVQELLGRGQP